MSAAPLLVACLCADWCGVCRAWRAAFEAQARVHPHAQFAWVDVEDESDAMGEVDVETFPTLLVARGGEPLFLGPVLPSGPGFARLLAALQGEPQPFQGDQAAARGLLHRLQGPVLARSRV